MEFKQIDLSGRRRIEDFTSQDKEDLLFNLLTLFKGQINYKAIYIIGSYCFNLDSMPGDLDICVPSYNPSKGITDSLDKKQIKDGFNKSLNLPRVSIFYKDLELPFPYYDLSMNLWFNKKPYDKFRKSVKWVNGKRMICSREGIGKPV